MPSPFAVGRFGNGPTGVGASDYVFGTAMDPERPMRERRYAALFADYARRKLDEEEARRDEKKRESEQRKAKSRTRQGSAPENGARHHGTTALAAPRPGYTAPDTMRQVKEWENIRRLTSFAEQRVFTSLKTRLPGRFILWWAI